MRHSSSLSGLFMLTGLLLGCGTADPQDLHDQPISPLGGSVSASLAPTFEANPRPVESDELLSGTLLMTWYADANYGGANTQIVQYSGPCDSTGYGIRYVGDSWNDKISSFKTFNNCNTVTAYTNSNYGGTAKTWSNPGASGVNVPWVGTDMNDKISSFRVYRR